MNPTVSFVIPCYKLAHLLGECIDSILGQTYKDFEILILDDCSPDDTAEVVAAYQDPRIRYIRNEVNLRHLQNYNKGISLSRGEHVWLISADDCLRRPYVLERYVQVLKDNPRVGYVFCPGVGLYNGQETGVLDYSVHGDHDAVFNGRQFLKKLIHANTIVAASGLVRKTCYDTVGMFPLDMPWGGDWYLWCAFAFDYDVAYLAEPMVCYRRHDCSMTNVLMDSDLGACYSDDIRIPWIMKAKADGTPGCADLSRECLRSIAREYARRIAGKHYKAAATYVGMPLKDFAESLNRSKATEAEKTWVRARVFAGVADQYHFRGDFAQARNFYFQALRQDPRMPKIWAKWALLCFGKAGVWIRQSLPGLRRAAHI